MNVKELKQIVIKKIEESHNKVMGIIIDYCREKPSCRTCNLKNDSSVCLGPVIDELFARIEAEIRGE